MDRASIVVLTIALVGCNARQETPKRSCYVVSATGQKLFTDSIECMRQLPRREMNGFWRLGYESSTFFQTFAEARSRSDVEHAMQLSWDPKQTPELSKYSWPTNGRRVFRIRFIGAESSKSGFYGSSGERAGAVFVAKIIAIQEL